MTRLKRTTLFLVLWLSVARCEPHPCIANPCGAGSTCQREYEGFTCLCLVGQVYQDKEKRCAEGQEAPASTMGNRVAPAAAESTVIAVVENLFTLDSAITEEDVKKALHSPNTQFTPWQLVLVIVGSVLGGLLLIMIIVVGVLSSRKSTKKMSDSDDETPYYSHSLAKAPLINSKGSMLTTGNNGFPKIPRATPRNSFGPTNLEMTPNNGLINVAPRASQAARPSNDPAQNRATTNPYTQNRATTNQYAQNRATTNQYAQNRDPYQQNRATINPYDRNQAPNNQKQGYTNLDYMHDDERSGMTTPEWRISATYRSSG
ncbi:unnamed protein product [Merluccius merluccius]